mmetsp:Transcript_21499/g.68110  ORF Transcript_21499/g.68110 Transcript_21499/m.68110 type:complete len:203 (+) Transcript_21499:261-869(+)
MTLCARLGSDCPRWRRGATLPLSLHSAVASTSVGAAVLRASSARWSASTQPQGSGRAGRASGPCSTPASRRRQRSSRAASASAGEMMGNRRCASQSGTCPSRDSGSSCRHSRQRGTLPARWCWDDAYTSAVALAPRSGAFAAWSASTWPWALGARFGRWRRAVAQPRPRRWPASCTSAVGATTGACSAPSSATAPSGTPGRA